MILNTDFYLFILCFAFTFLVSYRNTRDKGRILTAVIFCSKPLCLNLTGAAATNIYEGYSEWRGCTLPNANGRSFPEKQSITFVIQKDF